MQRSDTEEPGTLPGHVKRLQSIADLIGCHPSAFYGASTGIAEIDDANELLHLLLAIKLPGERRRVIELARALAEKA